MKENAYWGGGATIVTLGFAGITVGLLCNALMIGITILIATLAAMHWIVWWKLRKVEKEEATAAKQGVYETET